MLGCPLDFFALNHHRDDVGDEQQTESCQRDEWPSMIETGMPPNELRNEHHNQVETGHVAKNLHPSDGQLSLFGA